MEDIVFGIDIGTTKICALVGAVRNREMRIIGLGIYQMATQQQKEAAAKPDSGITINEDGTVQVPWRWTKDNPGKLPQPVQIMGPGNKPVMVNGRPLWSFDERDDFMRAVVEHYAAELKAKHDAGMTAAEQAAPVAQPAPVQQPSQKMPPPDLKVQQQQARHAPPLTAEENALPELDRHEVVDDSEVNPW